ncbi:hypothetical protein KY289_011393 [Solanum tuberosum]|nr:hypothetical protein KY289_011393 [Solanum tuberosum]
MKNICSRLEIDHLPRIGSDHAPMLLTSADGGVNKKKPFRLQKKGQENDKKKHYLCGVETLMEIFFSNLSLEEEIAIIKEKLFDEDASIGYDWFENGDRNTRFFHSLVKGRRQKSRVNRIENSHGDWLEEEGAIANEVVEYFDKKFQQEGDATSFPLLSYISKEVSEEENAALCAFPVLEDVKKVVFKLSIDGVSGPDRLTSRFF